MTREEAIRELKEDIELYIPLRGTIDDVDRDLPDGRLITALEMAIKALEQEPNTGHWINVNEGKWNTIPAYKCSVCGANANLRDWSGESPFCPWCGAKMVEPQESEGTDADNQT